jgi:predicted nucleotidyltransferase
MEYLTNYKHPNKPSLVVLTGSHLYGVANEDSDMDYRGFTLPTADQVLGLEKFEQHESKDLDVVIYNYTKFLHLLESGSPNIVELLFASSKNILVQDDIAKHIISNSSKFISQKWISAHVGFAVQSFREFQQIQTSKSVYHSVRLLCQAKDILKALRNNEISLEGIYSIYEGLLSQVREFESKYELPKDPDREFIKGMKREVYYSIIKSA